MPVSTTGFAHVRLTVSDLPRSRAFYEQVFGYPVAFEVPADADEARRPARSRCRSPSRRWWRWWGRPPAWPWCGRRRSPPGAGDPSRHPAHRAA